MKISKDSWHYRALTQGLFWLNGWEASKSLCLYFWQVVGMITLGIVMAFVLSSPVVTLVNIFTGYAPEVYILGILYNVWGCIGIFIILAFLFFVFALCIVIPVELVKFVYKKYHVKRVKVSSEQKQNLLISYIKAKKDKVCPIIEFEG